MRVLRSGFCVASKSTTAISKIEISYFYSGFEFIVSRFLFHSICLRYFPKNRQQNILRMEQDRAQVDLGRISDTEAVEEGRQQERQPRRRIVGRKEAADRAERNGLSNTSFDDRGAMQRKLDDKSHHTELTEAFIPSHKTSKDGASPQPSST